MAKKCVKAPSCEWTPAQVRRSIERGCPWPVLDGLHAEIVTLGDAVRSLMRDAEWAAERLAGALKALGDLDQRASVEVLGELGPNDLLVVRVHDAISAEACQRIKEAAAQLVGDDPKRVIVMTSDMRLGVLKRVS